MHVCISSSAFRNHSHDPQASKQTTWDIPDHLRPTGALIRHDVNVALDAQFCGANPTAADLPALPVVDAATLEQQRATARREVAAKALSARTPALSALTPVPTVREAALLGPGSWTHATGGSNIVQDVALQAGIAAAIGASAPAFDGNLQLGVEWKRLVATLAAPDAHTRPDVLQLLASAPDAFRDDGHVRTALAALLAASYKGYAPSVGRLSAMLDQYVPSPQAAATSMNPAAAAQTESKVGGRGVAFAPEIGGTGTPAPPSTGASPAAGSVLVSRGEDVAIDRLADMLAVTYTTEVGRSLAPPALPPNLPPSAQSSVTSSQLQSQLQPQSQSQSQLPLPSQAGPDSAHLADRIVEGMTPFAAWRRRILELSERHPEDPFLQRAVTTFAQRGYRRDMALATILVASVTNFQAVTTSVAGELAAAPEIASAAPTRLAASAIAEHRQQVLSLLDHHEFGAITTLHVLQDAAAAAARQGTHAAAALQRALRLGTARQALGYRILQRGKELSMFLGVAPAAAELVVGTAAGGADGLAQPAVPKLFEQLQQLRAAALSFFHDAGGRMELFPEEDQLVHAPDATSLGVRAGPRAPGSITAVSAAAAMAEADSGGGGSGDTTESASELEAERLRAASFSAKRVDAATLRTVVALLTSLSVYALDRASLGALLAQLQSDTAALAAGDDADGAHAAAIAGTNALLAAFRCIAGVMRQPDVIALMLHLLFHPAVATEEASVVEESGAPPASALAVVAMWLAWAVDVAAVYSEDVAEHADPGGDTDMVDMQRTPAAVDKDVVALVLGSAPSAGSATLPPANVTDACLPRSLVVSDDNAAAAAAGGAAVDINTKRTASYGLFASACLDCARSVKAGGPLHDVGAGLLASGASAAMRHASLEAAARELAGAMVRASLHPALALGLMHWMRHALINPAVIEDPYVVPLVS